MHCRVEQDLNDYEYRQEQASMSLQERIDTAVAGSGEDFDKFFDGLDPCTMIELLKGFMQASAHDGSSDAGTDLWSELEDRISEHVQND